MTPADLDARLAFAFPEVDVAASGLDPFDAEDRRELVRRSLPGIDDLAPDDPELGARVAETILLFRVALAELIVHDTLEVWPAVLRLRDDGVPNERIQEMLVETAIDHLDPTSPHDGPADSTEFVRALRSLPDDPDELEQPLDDLEWMIDEWREQPDLSIEADIAQILRSTIHDDLVDQLGDDFVPLDALVQAFAPALRLSRPDARDVLRMYLALWTPDVFIDPADVVVHETVLIEGVRFRHRLSDAEAATERLDDTIDLAVLLDGFDLGEVKGLGPLHQTFRTAVDGDETERGGVRVVEGPAGWLAGASAGEVIAATRSGAAVEVEVMAEDAAADAARAVDSLRQVRETLAGEMPIDIYRAYRVAAVHARGFGRDLGRPLSDLLVDAGWSIDDHQVAPADFDWERHRDEQRVRGELSILRRAGVDSPDEAPAVRQLITELFGPDVSFDPDAIARPVDDELVDAVSTLLSRPGFATATFMLALGTRPSPTSLASVRDIALSLVDRTKANNVSGPARLGLIAADREDRVDVVVDLLGRAHVNAVDDELLCSIAGDVELDRGRLDAARRHYDRGDVHLPDAVYAPIAAAAGSHVAGRNDPCPCGSGQKFKRCHGAPGGPPLTDVDRARLLIARLSRHDVRREHFGVHRWHRLAGLVIDDEWMTDDASMFLPFIETLSWFEDRGLATYLESRGHLLPPDDRALAESWVGSSIVVGHEDDGDVVLTDGRAVADCSELGGYGVGGPPIATMGRLVTLDGVPTLIRGVWIGERHADAAAELLATADGSADAVADAVGAIRRRSA